MMYIDLLIYWLANYCKKGAPLIFGTNWTSFAALVFSNDFTINLLFHSHHLVTRYKIKNLQYKSYIK